MSMYGHRSIQRLRRDEQAVASSSRHPTSSGRRGTETTSSRHTASHRREARSENSHVATEAQTEVHSASGSDDEEEDEDELRLRSYTQLSVSDTARKQADQMGDAEVLKKATDLARYALACEYTRTTIRKDDIRTKLLDKPHSRAFPVIFNAAQKILHDTFGFNMVEVRPKGKDNAELVKQAKEVLRNAASDMNGLRSRRPRNAEDDEAAATAEGGPSTTWQLVSALPPRVTKMLASADEELTNAYAESDCNNTSSSSQRRRPRANEPKSALDWTSADKQGGEMGLLYFILAIILVNGRTISDPALHMYLRRLHLEPHTRLPKALYGTGPALGSASAGTQVTQTQSRSRSIQGTLEGFFNTMVKQSYLEKQRSEVIDVMDAAVNQSQAQGRRGRASGGAARNADDDQVLWEWRWGSRAEVEVGEKRIGEFISTILLEQVDTQGAVEAGEGDNEETQTIDRNRMAKRRKTLLSNIASAAGSQLVE